MSRSYPVAANADQALSQPLGRAVRESEAKSLAGEAVEFVSEMVGPGFATRQAAVETLGARLEDEACEVREVMVRKAGRLPQGGQVQPIYRDGRRWPEPPRQVDTVWRLSLTYWRVVDASPLDLLDQARRARKHKEAADTLDARHLRALTHQPLRAVRPQQPLDIGLFEVRAPEAPHILIPDE